MRFARWTCLLCALTALPLAACPAPDPPKSPAERPLNEVEAKAELEEATEKGDPEALLEVYHKYKKFPSGRTALNRGVKKLLEQAREAAEKCDVVAAKTLLARVNPYALDFPAIQEAWDEIHADVEGERKSCAVKKLDEDIKRHAAAWDWPKVFQRISADKEVAGADLSRRRLDAIADHGKMMDDTLKDMIKQKSADKVLGDKREMFEASLDPSKFPPELEPEISKRAGTAHVLLAILDNLEGLTLLDPPVRYWVYGKAKGRKMDALDAKDPIELPNGLAFYAIARGKMAGISMLVGTEAGAGELLFRIGKAKVVLPESDARNFDTNTVLPEKLTGIRVLAPFAAGSDQLTPSVVLSESGTTVVALGVGKKTGKVTAKRSELRGYVLAPGQAVSVYVGTAWKKGEIADAPEEERVLVRVSGFESFFSLADVRVKRADLPAPPPTK